MLVYILGIVIIILDGILAYYLPSYFNNLNYFYPMFSITYLVSLYGYTGNYFKNSLILGFIYDLFYSNIFLYNTLLFLLLGKINKKIFNYLSNNLWNKIFILIFNIIIYDSINYLIVYFSKYNNVLINDLIYKISHSLILNIFFIIVLNFIMKKFIKKDIIR